MVSFITFADVLCMESAVLRLKKGNKIGWHRASGKFLVSFNNDISLLEKFFPTPVIQMDIEANIPWVLKEKNSYLL